MSPCRPFKFAHLLTKPRSYLQYPSPPRPQGTNIVTSTITWLTNATPELADTLKHINPENDYVVGDPRATDFFDTDNLRDQGLVGIYRVARQHVCTCAHCTCGERYLPKVA